MVDDAQIEHNEKRGGFHSVRAAMVDDAMVTQRNKRLCRTNPSYDAWRTRNLAPRASPKTDRWHGACVG